MTKTFKKEVNNLYRELIALKTQKERMANTLQTKEQSFNISFDLILTYEWGVANIHSKKNAIIDINTFGHNPLVSVRSNMNNLDNRSIFLLPIYDHSTGHIGYSIGVFSYNQSDYDTLSGGGSVTLNYTFTITATSDTNISISYKDNN